MRKLGLAAVAAFALTPVSALAQSGTYMMSHSSHTGLGIVALLILLVVGIALIALHFLPGIIASRRNHRNALAIWLVNIFFGWTLIGWVVALIWALN